MTYPKIKPCPRCGETDTMEAYKYDNGWHHVECEMDCGYMGPGSGSILGAIRGHNEYAQAIEARRAETQGGSVHESAVTEGDAPNSTPETPQVQP